MELTTTQQSAVQVSGPSFLLGPAGTGKSTSLRQRLLRLLEEGKPAYSILILVAEPEHRQAFLDLIHQSDVGPYADLNITTFHRLALEMVSLFWPLVARPHGFTQPHKPPTPLSYDLAQLLMWHVVTPMLGSGAFADLRLRPQQIVSQILDMLNGAALNRLTIAQALERQLKTWTGEPQRLQHFRDTAAAARTFRHICLQNSLLDLSLLAQVFDNELIQHPEFHRYFRERYQYLIVDNIEEQTPVGQHFVESLMPATESATIAYDAGGGYKRFLGADPLSANRFYQRAQQVITFEENLFAPAEVMHVANLVENYLMHTQKPVEQASEALPALVRGRYRREMVARLIPVLEELLEQGIAPLDIAIIAPYLDEAMRYMLVSALRQARLPHRLLRRRISPRDEPRVRTWLTWLTLAHPQWGITPSAYDVTEALTLSIHSLDPARAQLLTRQLYREDEHLLQPVDALSEDIAARIGAEGLELVEELRRALAERTDQTPVDLYLHRLFVDLLAQPRFQPRPDPAAAAVSDWLVRRASHFRQAAPSMGFATNAEVGRAFVQSIQEGLVIAHPPEVGEPPDPEGMSVSTIYGYLLAGRPARVQVWMEASNTAWWDIPRQPLSNAFVLAQSYDPEQRWTAETEFGMRNQVLSRLVRGLTQRCSEGIIIASSELDRRGVRHDGPLWRALQPALRHKMK